MKKRYKLKPHIAKILYVILILVIVAFLLIAMDKQNKDFIKSCTEQGYSERHCHNALMGSH